MSDPTVRGIVHVVEETKTYGQKGFQKRLFVLEQNDGRYTNYVPLELVQDNCHLADNLSVGDEVEVVYRLSGRKWQRDSRYGPAFPHVPLQSRRRQPICCPQRS